MQDVFSDGRYVLSWGEDVRMIHYVQEEDAEKTCLQLPDSIVCFILRGRKWLYHPGGKVTVAPGEGFFAARGNYLRTERLAEGPLGYVSLVIRLSDVFLASLDRLGDQEDASPGPVCLLRQDALLNTLVGQLAGYFQTPGEKARVESILPFKIRELLTLLASVPANRGFGTLLRQGPLTLADPLHALMEAHFRESLSLEQWAFLAGLSRSSFKRKFETAYNMPPGRWIQQRRLKEAYALLEDRRLNVTEVCYEVGFENLAHFVHAFKEHYGVTPKQRQLGEPQTIVFGPQAKPMPEPLR